jgi:hypothetical protein
MKTKKSAALTALKPTVTKSTTTATTTAPKSAPVAPKYNYGAVALAPSAPRPAPAAPMAAKTAPPAQKSTAEALTIIEVKIDVGFGNAVFLRGQGFGLTWERGVPLVCVDGGTWRWTQKVADPVTFKVLLNDQVWSSGDDLVVVPGQKVEVSPSFA